MKILIADDEQEMTRALKAVLEHEKYSVDTVADGAAALEQGLSGSYDCLVLDIMMPRADGLSVLRTLRENGISSPVLLLTAKALAEDKIAGLDQGADDYLTKPFDVGEFMARIRALTRRSAGREQTILSAGNIQLNRSTQEITCSGASICLGSRESAMMELLIRRKGQFISSEQFLEHIWRNETEQGEDLIWTYISYLRKKLSALGANISIISQEGCHMLKENREE